MMVPKVAEKPINIYYCYALADKWFPNQLSKHLSTLKFSEKIEEKHSFALFPGSDITEEVNNHINEADIILLFITPDFFASKDCQTQMTAAINRHSSEECLLYPILSRSVDWSITPLNDFELLPTNKRPIKNWSNQDKAFQDVTSQIRQGISEIRAKLILEEAESHFQNNSYSNCKACYEWILSYINKITNKTLKIALYEKQALLGLGDTYCKLLDFNQAITAYEEVIDYEPESSEAYAGKGDALFWSGKYLEALSAYEKSLRLNSFQLRALRGKAYTLRAMDYHEEARIVYMQMLRFLNPQSVEEYVYKSEAFYYCSAYIEALSVSEIAIQLRPNYALAYNAKANALRALDRYEEALTFYEEAIKLEPNLIQPLYNKGLLLRIENKKEEALIIFDQVTKLNPNYVLALDQKAFLLYSLNRYQEAKIYALQALNLNPRDTRVLRILEDIYVIENNTKKQKSIETVIYEISDKKLERRRKLEEALKIPGVEYEEEEEEEEDEEDDEHPF